MGRIKFADSRTEYLQALVKLGEEARKELSSNLILQPKQDFIPLKDAFRFYSKSCRRPSKANEKSLERYDQYTEELIRVAAHGTGFKMSEVTSHGAEAYCIFLDANNAPATVNMKLAWFRLLWKTLQVEPNPWTGLSSNQKKAVKAWRRLTLQECRDLYEATRFYQPLILLGYYTGQRLIDCVRMSASDIHFRTDFEESIIKITQSKTGKEVFIPIISEMNNCPLGIYTIDKRAKYSRDIKKIMDSIGIKDNGGKVGFHSLRKTFVSMMDEGGTPVNVTNSVTGHDSGSMHDRYSQTDIEAARGWMLKSIKSLVRK